MKTIIIGIDGGTWDVMLPLIKKGKLPNIARLMETGVWGNLHSTYPPITVPAWVSCVTGVNPGKIGLFHFLNDIHDDYKGKVPNPENIKIKRIWDILTEYHKKVILITIPFTNPPPVVNGVVLSSARLGMPQVIDTYPKYLLSELMKFLDITVESFRKEFAFKTEMRQQLSREEYLEKISKISLKFIQRIYQTVLYLIQHYDWDFLMVVFSSTDLLQHHFWAYQDINHPFYERHLAQKFGNVIEKAYLLIDKTIGAIKENCSKDMNIFVVSDHGFGPLHKQFFVNNWLIKERWLSLKRNAYNFSLIEFSKILSKLNLDFFKKCVPSAFLKIKLPILKKKTWPENINWDKTMAYGAGAGININLKGREPEGIVASKKEYDDIVDEIKRKLFQVKDPETGENIIDKVFRQEEIYKGPYTKNAPDLLFFFKSSEYLPKYEVKGKDFIQVLDKGDLLNGHHWSCFNGIFILNTPYIKPGIQVNNAHIMDITPTTLYLMGLPVAEEMDGRVWIEVVKPEFQKKYPLRKVKYNHYKEKREIKFGKEEEEEIKRQLQDLGYLG